MLCIPQHEFWRGGTLTRQKHRKRKLANRNSFRMVGKVYLCVMNRRPIIVSE
jgi:hypothetical protein